MESCHFFNILTGGQCLSFRSNGWKTKPWFTWLTKKQKLNTSYQPSGTVACFEATGPGHLVVIKSSKNSFVHQGIVGSHARPSVWQVKLNQNWVMQQRRWSLAHQQISKKKNFRVCLETGKDQTSAWLKQVHRRRWSPNQTDHLSWFHVCS